MLKGDLVTTPLAEVLTTLAETEATGCLHIDPADGGDEALLYLKAGLVYAAHVPGRRPQLGARLVSGGALPPEALEEALEAQQTELQGWRLGELLVHLGYVEGEVVESFVVEQLRQAAFDLSTWREGTWKFRKNEKTREDVGGRSSVTALLAEVERRRALWEQMQPVVHGLEAVPMLSSAGSSSAEMTLDQDQWALLCKVDGERTLGQLARDCGFTTFEAAEVVFGLVTAGLVEVEEPVADEEDEDVPAEAMSTASALSSAIAMLGGAPPATDTAADETPAADGGATEPAPDAEPAAAAADDEWSGLLDDHEPGAADGSGESELGRLFSFSSGEEVVPGAAAEASSAGAPRPEPPAAPAARAAPAAASGDDDPLSRVSQALDELLAGGLQPVEPPPVVSLAAINLPEEPVVDPVEQERLERIRAAAAAELAAAHADAEQTRRLHETQSLDEIESMVAALREQSATSPVTDHDYSASPATDDYFGSAGTATEEDRIAAEIVAAEAAERDRQVVLETERLAAEEAERERQAVAAADRLAAEEAQRVTQEAERTAAAAEADRLAAEELERAAAAAEAVRLAAEEAERAAAERAAAYDAGAAAAERGDVAAALSDFSASSPTAQPEPAPAPEPVAEPAAAADQYAAPTRPRDSDTASLLRELSSLGFDDDAPPSPQAPRPPAAPPRPPARPPEPPKKRKGLFGR